MRGVGRKLGGFIPSHDVTLPGQPIINGVRARPRCANWAAPIPRIFRCMLSAIFQKMAESDCSAGRWGVLLLAHGAPERVADVPAFLLNVRGGRPLPPQAVAEIEERYRLISKRQGGRPEEASPLTWLTARQAEALRERLKRPVYVGMRNWTPYIAEAVNRAAADHVERLIAVCLAPQNSRTSVGKYRDALEEARARLAPGVSVDFIASWHDHPGLIAAYAARLEAAISNTEVEAAARRENFPEGHAPVIFTAHSVPESTIRSGDPYEEQVRETARLVAEYLQLSNARCSVAFQSQGMTREPWIGPTVESEIDRWSTAGYRHVVIAPIGFVCDHVEILYDIDIALRKYADERGVTLSRSESLNDSPLFIEAMADLVIQRTAREVSADA
jgi:protoporphyrin/coproporphyrin ferrochelatase